VRSTYRPEVLGDIGGFGGLFRFAAADYRDPVLVSSTDGVGTKAHVATAVGRFDTIGIDLVAMCVDDLVCTGAEPLFFLDYLSFGQLDPDQARQLVAGVAEGCRQAGCALIGGEMAEHPGLMAPGEFDLAGFAVGVVERDRMITGEQVSPGDVLIGLPSPGLRSNGYSLARRLMFDVAGRSVADPAWDEPGAPTAGDELLVPSVIYAPAIRALIDAVEVHSIAHITGGGLPGNLNRVLGGHSDAVVDPESWEWPRIFAELQRIGDVELDEMRKVFNLGIGMVAVVPPEAADAAVSVLAGVGVQARRIGEVVAGTGVVRFAD
jgi:phosphoribosylformylglycinamidine cyclo-ligase